MIRKESSLLGSVLPKLNRIKGRVGGGANAPSLQRATKPPRWHSVSIDAKPLSCITARELHKTRYLSKDAPTLPLKGCSKSAACPCTYKHHEDRRAKSRRAAEGGTSSNGKKRDGERRTSRGRRQEDQG